MSSEPDVHVIRLRLPCETSLEFYANYAKQLAGAFFVAQELPVAEEGRVSVHVSLSGSDLELSGEGVARPSTKSGRRGIVIQLDQLQEVHGAEEDEEDGEDPFGDSATRASELPGQLAARLRQSLNLSTQSRPHVIRRDSLAAKPELPSGEETEELYASISISGPDASEPEPEEAAAPSTFPRGSNHGSEEEDPISGAEEGGPVSGAEEGGPISGAEEDGPISGAGEEAATPEVEKSTPARSEPAPEREAAPVEVAAPKRRGRGKLFLFLLILLCGGAGAAAYFYPDQLTALWHEILARLG